MKHRALTGLVASSVGLLLTLGFACVDADIPNVNNRLRDALEQTYANAGAPPVGAGGDGGSASTPMAGAGGAPDDGGEPAPDPGDGGEGGAAGSSMVGMGGAGGSAGDDGAAGAAPVVGGGCDGFEVLQEYCATSGCHGQPGAALGDFASSEDAAREFIGRESGLSCAGQGAIIDQENPEDSLMVTKMTTDFTCGSRMPPTGVELSEAEVACVQEWIAGL